MALPYDYTGSDPGRGGTNIGGGGGGGLGGGGGMLGGIAGRTPGRTNNMTDLMMLMRKRFGNLGWSPSGANAQNSPFGNGWGGTNVEKYNNFSQLSEDRLGELDRGAGMARGLQSGFQRPGATAQGFSGGQAGGMDDMIRRLLQARMGGGGGL